MQKSRKMKYSKLMPIFCIIALSLILLLRYFSPSIIPEKDNIDLNTHLLYSQYQFSRDPQVIHFGIQPLGVPIGAISELFKRDKILKDALAQLNFKLTFYDFLNGGDLNYFWNRGLDIGMSGDMPTIVAAANNDVVVSSLIKQEFTSFIAREYSLLPDFKGKKIAIPFGSNAHYSVLRALELENMSPEDVKLVNLNVHQHAQALATRKIDAFAAWEPFPTVARTINPEFIVVHKGLSSSYLFFSDRLFKNHPEVSSLILAAQVRAMNWMNLSKDNLHQVSKWQLQAYERVMNKKSPLNIEQNSELIRNGLLSIRDTPVISQSSLAEQGFLQQAFLFLQKMEIIKVDVNWEKVRKRFKTRFIAKVLNNKEYYQLEQFDYRQGLYEAD